MKRLDINQRKQLIALLVHHMMYSDDKYAISLLCWIDGRVRPQAKDLILHSMNSEKKKKKELLETERSNIFVPCT